MPKQRHTIKRCRVRLRPKMAAIRRKMRVEFAQALEEKDQAIAQLCQTLRETDKGRTLRSHLSGWWANRKTA